jgi:hypothetical protein
MAARFGRRSDCEAGTCEQSSTGTPATACSFSRKGEGTKGWRMSRSERYLARAAECERLAIIANDQQIKRQFAEVARHWRELATASEQAERIGTSEVQRSFVGRVDRGRRV